MRIPTFPRQSTAEEADTERTPVVPRRDDSASTTATLPPVKPATTPVRPVVTEAERARTVSEPVTVPARPVAGPKARVSFAATLGLILAVAGALLVLSGPLLGYGVGVAGVALVLSLAGLFGTRKRHVAGKSSALIGVLLSIAALVIGVLALAGQLWWLGTDVQTVPEFRTWLDTQFATRF